MDQSAANVQANVSWKLPPGGMKEWAKLCQSLTKYFSKDELYTLCFDLGVDYENFPEAKRGIARELIAHLERCGRISELLQVCKQRRPNAPW